MVFRGQPGPTPGQGKGFQGGGTVNQYGITMTTTPYMEGYRVVQYLGVCMGQAINVPNFVQDFFAKIRGSIGGRVKDFEGELVKTKDMATLALQEDAAAKGANAILMVDYDFTVAGAEAQMFIACATGTAVIVEPSNSETDKLAPSMYLRGTDPGLSKQEPPKPEPPKQAPQFTGFRDRIPQTNNRPEMPRIQGFPPAAAPTSQPPEPPTPPLQQENNGAMKDKPRKPRMPEYNTRFAPPTEEPFK